MLYYIQSLQEFNDHLYCAGRKLVVVDFCANWCGPCRKMDPIVERISAEYGSDVIFLKVDVDIVPEISEMYGVSCMPTFVFIRDRQEITQFSGADDYMLTSWIEDMV